MPTYDANGNLLINTNASTVAQSVSAPALTKGSQAATGFSTQDLKDSGRTQITLYVDSVSGITTEALATLNITKGDAAQSTATSYTVTAGKTFRVQSLTLSVMVPSTTGCASRVRLRTAASSIAATSPVLAHVGVGTPATAFSGNSAAAVIPDGLEIAGGNQVAISHIESSAITGSTTSGAGVQICLIGYEY